MANENSSSGQPLLPSNGHDFAGTNSESVAPGHSGHRSRSVRRVLFLAKYLDSGGVTTHMMTLAQELRSQGIEVGVISAGQFGDHSMNAAWFENAQVPHFTLNYASRNPLVLASAALRTLRVVRTFKPDVLHVHWRVTSPYAQLVSLVQRVPFVVTLHLLGIGEGRLHRIISFWGRQTIAISSETRHYLREEFRVPEKQLHTVYNGADGHRFRLPVGDERVTARERFGVKADEVAIALIGRLEQVKGHAVLFEAVAPLIAQGINLRLLLAGQGTQRDALERSARELGIHERVSFLGHTDTRDVLWASDLSVLPSFKEGFPLTTVESMLCGSPHIRSATSGARDVITDSVDGFVIPVGDVEQLRARIRLLVSDGDLRTRIAQAAHTSAIRNFTAERMAEQTLAVYELAVDA